MVGIARGTPGSTAQPGVFIWGHVSKHDRDRRHDARRRREKPWRALYKTARWQAIRRQQLAEHPLCQRCLQRGQVVRATVVHHVERHDGDPLKFFGGPFASRCKPCHDSDDQAAEAKGYSAEIGADGWPVDTSHPLYSGSA